MKSTFFVINQLTALVRPIIAKVEAGSLSSPRAWRPKEWDGPALTSITAPVTRTDKDGKSYQGSQLYVFDAIMRADHQRRLTITQHPIQTDAASPVSSIRDHAYSEPATVTLEIGMSDVMDSWGKNDWQGGASKSVNAFHTLCDLQRTRTLLTLTTRLQTYRNMCIESIQSPDSAETLYGLRATVTFTEVFLAQVTASQIQGSSAGGSKGSTVGPDGVVSGSVDFGGNGGVVDAGSQTVSARPQTTDATPLGTVQPSTAPSSLEQTRKTDATANIPGAGQWSSNGVGIDKSGNAASLGTQK